MRTPYLHYFILPAAVVDRFSCKLDESAIPPDGQVVNALANECNLQRLHEVQHDSIAHGEPCRHVILKTGQKVLLFREAFGEGMPPASAYEAHC